MDPHRRGIALGFGVLAVYPLVIAAAKVALHVNALPPAPIYNIAAGLVIAYSGGLLGVAHELRERSWIFTALIKGSRGADTAGKQMFFVFFGGALVLLGGGLFIAGLLDVV